jgi:choline dehydrogenase-like flavoprotein
MQSIGIMPVTYASQVARARGTWGPALREQIRRYNNAAGINLLGECLPYDSNYVELSDELDDRGLPKPRVHFTAGENEKALSAHGEALMRDIWVAAGATDIWSYARTAHILGTSRMGNEAEAAVVNAEGRSFDVPNLYVSDASTFPSSLSANPALTIMALALRTADRFLARNIRREH